MIKNLSRACACNQHINTSTISSFSLYSFISFYSFINYQISLLLLRARARGN